MNAQKIGGKNTGFEIESKQHSLGLAHGMADGEGSKQSVGRSFNNIEVFHVE